MCLAGIHNRGRVIRQLGQSQLFIDEASKSAVISRDDVITFLSRCSPRLGRSLLSGVSSVPPMHSRTGRSSVTVEDTLHLQADPPIDSLAKAVREVRRAVSDSVIETARSATKVGVLLSGGFDSTLLCLTLAAARIPFSCYIVEYEGRVGPKEFSYAASVAAKTGATLRRVKIPLRDILECADQVARARALPCVTWVAANQMRASEAAAKDGCDVVLSGFGSDEVFGGYTHFGLTALAFNDQLRALGERAWDVMLGVPSQARTKALFRGLCSAVSHRTLQAIFQDCDLPRVVEEDLVLLVRAWRNMLPHYGYDALMLITELTVRSFDVIVEELRTASQLAGVRAEFPFLSSPVVRVGIRTPISYKYVVGSAPGLRFPPSGNAVEKYVLRLAFDDVVPQVVAQRRRRMFTAPFPTVLLDPAIREKLITAVTNSPVWRDIGAVGVDRLVSWRGGGDPWDGPFRAWTAYQVCNWYDSDGPSRFKTRVERMNRQHGVYA
jgi:asparagine synthetase B (glutamine-hydrolysing)